MAPLYRWGHCLDNIRTAASPDLCSSRSQTEFSLKGNSQLIKVNLLPNSDQIWFETQTDKHTRRGLSLGGRIHWSYLSQILSRVQRPRKRIRVSSEQWVTMFLMCLSVFVCALTSLSRYYFLSAVPASAGLACSPGSLPPLSHSFSRINKIILVININVLLSKLNTNPREPGHKAHKAWE